MATEVRSFIIKNKLGLHARAAGILVQKANRFACDIKIEKDGLEVNAKSIMGVMMLAAAKFGRLRALFEETSSRYSIQKGTIFIFSPRVFSIRLTISSNSISVFPMAPGPTRLRCARTFHRLLFPSRRDLARMKRRKTTKRTRIERKLHLKRFSLILRASAIA